VSEANGELPACPGGFWLAKPLELAKAPPDPQPQKRDPSYYILPIPYLIFCILFTYVFFKVFFLFLLCFGSFLDFLSYMCYNVMF
jgi:hypothetical protein